MEYSDWTLRVAKYPNDPRNSGLSLMNLFQDATIFRSGFSESCLESCTPLESTANQTVEKLSRYLEYCY